MEEEKAAAYYEELNRKGEGARRFKQGLGFSSDEPQPAAVTSKPTTSSSFLSGFVRAGATPAQLPKSTRPPPPPEAAPRQRRRSRSPSPSRTRSRSRSPSRSRRRRSRSRSRSRERRRRSRSRERGDRREPHHRSRSRSPSRRSSRSSHDEARRDRHGDRRRDDGGDDRQKGRGGRDGGKVDYSRLIQGYDKMTPAERVKAKMKLQLSETASKDSTLGTATVGWGRFEFNKDAPLDEDDDGVEGANDDASLVKHIGKSFRLSAVESKNENIVRDAHDEAMFGVPTNVDTETSEELKTNDEGKTAGDVEAQPSSSLISDELLAMQKGSWRERIQKLWQNSNT
ncbi:unnamed protein product [Alopecurus aequalis]